jgi:hypothetical protein
MLARQLLVRLTAAGLVATAAVAIAVLLARAFDDLSWRILGTTSTISLCALLAVPAGALLERRPRSILGRASAALTVLAFVLTVAGIWTGWHGAAGAKTWGVVATLAVAAAQGAAVEARRRETDPPSVRLLVRASAATGSLLAALGVAAILAEIANGAFLRGLGALAVLDLLLVVLPAVLRRGRRRAGRSVHRLRIDGRVVESEGRDFAAAVANAVRRAEASGAPVRTIERA